MSSAATINLTAGSLRIQLNPLVGGSISAFEWLGGGGVRPILRECHTARENVLDASSFPLVPYVNRIRGGAFTFRDREVRLAPNMDGDPSPLHGQGWLNRWNVDHHEEGSAALHFHHAPGEWRWEYEARQHFSLDERGLSLMLTCRNLSDEPMPCGLGQHPYFPCGGGTRIDTVVTHVWTINEHVLPVEKVPAEGRFDLRNRLVCGQNLDHGFGGWVGTTQITDPSWPYRIELSSPDAHFFQLYSPATGAIFVAEPVTHANAALNAPEQQWPELGMRVLEPGEEMNLKMRLEVIPT